jgi:hypothetical protein
VYDKTNSLLPSNKVNVIRKDENGFIWVGTNGGLVKINGDTWQTYTPANSGLPDTVVTSIEYDANNLWVGTFNKGVAKFSNSTWEVFNFTNGSFPSNQIFSLGFMEGFPLARVAEGVYKFENGTWDTIPGFFGLPNFYNRRIVEDNNGSLWFDKFFISVDSIFTLDTLPDLDTLISNNNYSLAEYKNGVFVNEFNFTNSGLQSNKIYSIFLEEGSNTLFVGTDGGNLTLYNPAGITLDAEVISKGQDHFYPNPSSYVLTFSKELETLSIQDMQGHLIYEGNETQLDVSSWSNGMYIVNWTSKGKVYQEKFVKN